MSPLFRRPHARGDGARSRAGSGLAHLLLRYCIRRTRGTWRNGEKAATCRQKGVRWTRAIRDVQVFGQAVGLVDVKLVTISRG